MKPMQAIRKAVKMSGKSLYRASKDLGKSSRYINSIITRGSTPNTDTLVKMLEVCGYSLCAVPSDKIPEYAIIIDNEDVPEEIEYSFSEIFNWNPDANTVKTKQSLYRINTGNKNDTLYFTATRGAPIQAIQEHAESEMRQLFGENGPTMIKSIDYVSFRGKYTDFIG